MPINLGYVILLVAQTINNNKNSAPFETTYMAHNIIGPEVAHYGP